MAFSDPGKTSELFGCLSDLIVKLQAFKMGLVAQYPCHLLQKFDCKVQTHFALTFESD